MTWAFGLGRSRRRAASADLSPVTASQRPRSYIEYICCGVARDNGLNVMPFALKRVGRVSSTSDPASRQIVAPFRSFRELTFRDLGTMNVRPEKILGPTKLHPRSTSRVIVYVSVACRMSSSPDFSAARC